MTLTKPLLIVLIGLIILTLASATLTLPVVGLHHQPVWSGVVFAIALVKARFVAAYFMELRFSPLMRAFDIWLVIVGLGYCVLSI